ncbi:MAG TPA: hypothetical protein VFT82_00565 [Candidatus Paceibacterota bacterium]|nr:hypothetical protein [Candidatus Paceibacterota bacterium]
MTRSSQAEPVGEAKAAPRHVPAATLADILGTSAAPKGGSQEPQEYNRQTVFAEALGSRHPFRGCEGREIRIGRLHR